ncbi:gliding motility-associated C-terminal domain-containing protein, partial [Acetobacterium sp. K1/6]|uniref:gliding motility-associated C-terminal domain-containing protein n=2 Tax=Bacteria TaxID=2 RepID=UPI002ACABF98
SDAGQLAEIHLEDGKKVIVGNALTPNGDGINDEWLIQYESDLNAPEVSIFNIYGQEIYHAKSYQNNWKGSYNGSILPNGAYYYLINFNQEKINPIRGTISILGKN